MSLGINGRNSFKRELEGKGIPRKGRHERKGTDNMTDTGSHRLGRQAQSGGQRALAGRGAMPAGWEGVLGRLPSQDALLRSSFE